MGNKREKSSKFFVFRTTARPTGVPGTLPAPRCLMSAALQAHSPADDTHSSIPVLQKMLPCRRHTHPPASCRDPCRSRNPCNLRDAQLEHLLEKSARRGPSVLNLLMFSTYCMYCIARALHCIALHCFEL